MGFVVISCVSGIILPVQAAINRRLSALACESSVLSVTFVSFMVGAITLVLASVGLSLVMFYAYSRTAIWDFRATSWWMYTNCLLGLSYVYGIVRLGPVIGMTQAFMFLVLGQLTLSLVFDTYGVLGVPQVDATPLRIAGQFRC